MAALKAVRSDVGTKHVPRPLREQQILDAAVEEFSARGYAHASVASIAQRAGISKPLVYDYFGSKDGLYVACLDRSCPPLVQAVADAQTPTDAERPVRTLAAIFSSLEARRNDWTVLYDATLPLDSKVHDAARSYRRQLSQLAAIGTHELLSTITGEVDELDTSLVADLWQNVVSTAVAWWIRHPDQSAADMAERCRRLLDSAPARATRKAKR